jgi:hypothetical protein
MKCKQCGCDMSEGMEDKEYDGDDSEMKLNLLDELQEMLGESNLKKIPKTSVKIAVVKPKGM